MAGGNLEGDFTRLAKDRKNFWKWLMKTDYWNVKKGTEGEEEFFKIQPILVHRSGNPGFLEGLSNQLFSFLRSNRRALV
jgi:hypothetical protein